MNLTQLFFDFSKYGKVLILSMLISFIASCDSKYADCKCDEPLPDTPAPAPQTHFTPPENGVRDWLTKDELTSGVQRKGSPYHNDYFMPVGEEAPARHQLNGFLHVESGDLFGFPDFYNDEMRVFPAFSSRFVTYNGYLLPEKRDIIIPDGNKSHWRIILSPGKVWYEAADGNMSRASFPFTMTERSWNSAFNGLATFLFDDSEATSLRVQLVQHTAPGIIGEASGTVAMDYQVASDDTGSQIIETFDKEMAQQLAFENLAELEAQFPALDWTLLRGGLSNTEVSASAVWFNETVYMPPCATKYGNYPYCKFMRHGVFSATKSAGGAVALTYLAQRYGTEVLDYYIEDYVEVTAEHEGWEYVTFKDALNMATGIGNANPDPESGNVFGDESDDINGRWSRAYSARDKLDIAFTEYGNYPWQPGEIFRYNTNHTFVLAAAMDSLVRQREGIGLWQLLKENVYEPIGIVHSPMMHTTERDSSRGVPILGVGLYPTVEDMIKIARLLHHNGAYQGQQILNRDVVRSALYRTQDEGLASHVDNNEFGEGRYNMSFWGLPYSTDDNCSMYIPHMAGAGGNYVVILPNGIITLRFTDGFGLDERGMVDIASRLKSNC